MHRTRVTAEVILLVAVCGLPLGCAGTSRPAGSSSSPVTLRIAGSDTMHSLLLRWADAYMQSHPGVVIHVYAGGTRTGFRALIEGTADLAAASRAMQPEEVRELHDRRGVSAQSILAAKDALSIYLHPENPVRSLTMAQLRGILSGSISHWAELGGENRKIDLVGRQPSSGTYFFMQEHVLGGLPEAADITRFPTTAEIADAVAANPGAIGYGGMAYGRNVFHCPLEGASPNPANVRSGLYPLARYLYLYTAGPPEGPIREFTDWILSAAAQAVVAEAGYIPLW